MSDGSGSTLVLQPDGLSEITFDLAVSTAIASGGYTVDLGSLRLGAEKREVVSYAESVGAEGGEKTGVTNPLVPVSFGVVVMGTTRADCMEKAHELRVALQAGGYLKYKPEDLAAGVTASFYRYLPSGPGALQARSGNRWDAVAKGGSFKLVLDVSIMTYPLLLSDPDSPVTVVNATTIYNHDDAGTGRDNWVTVPAASLKGDGRALLQITMRNLETGDYDDITGVYVFPRVYGLSNYRIVFGAGSVVVGGGRSPGMVGCL